MNTTAKFGHIAVLLVPVLGTGEKSMELFKMEVDLLNTHLFIV